MWVIFLDPILTNMLFPANDFSNGKGWGGRQENDLDIEGITYKRNKDIFVQRK